MITESDRIMITETDKVRRKTKGMQEHVTDSRDTGKNQQEKDLLRSTFALRTAGEKQRTELESR